MEYSWENAELRVQLEEHQQKLQMQEKENATLKEQLQDQDELGEVFMEVAQARAEGGGAERRLKKNYDYLTEVLRKLEIAE